MTHCRIIHTLNTACEGTEDWSEGASWPEEDQDLPETGGALTKIILASMIFILPLGSVVFLRSPTCFCSEMRTGYHLAEFGLQAWLQFCWPPLGIPFLSINSGGSSFLLPVVCSPEREQRWGVPWGQAGSLALPIGQVIQETGQGLFPFTLPGNPLRPETSHSVHWGRDLHPIGLRPLFQRQVGQITSCPPLQPSSFVEMLLGDSGPVPAKPSRQPGSLASEMLASR